MKKVVKNYWKLTKNLTIISLKYKKFIKNWEKNQWNFDKNEKNWWEVRKSNEKKFLKSWKLTWNTKKIV